MNCFLIFSLKSEQRQNKTLYQYVCLLNNVVLLTTDHPASIQGSNTKQYILAFKYRHDGYVWGGRGV